jgi:hypothetical protein
VREGTQSGTSVDRRAIVVTRAQLGFTGVQGNANAQRVRRRPRLTNQGALHRVGGRGRIGRAHEHREPTVALAARPDDHTAMLVDQFFGQLIVTSQSRTH